MSTGFLRFGDLPLGSPHISSHLVLLDFMGIKPLMVQACDDGTFTSFHPVNPSIKSRLRISKLRILRHILRYISQDIDSSSNLEFAKSNQHATSEMLGLSKSSY